ncbi:hypothetical protein [[Eubacterium] hominis]
MDQSAPGLQYLSRLRHIIYKDIWYCINIEEKIIDIRLAKSAENCFVS